MNHQAAMIRAAKKKYGKEVAELTTEEYAKLRLQVRSVREVVVDGIAFKTAQFKESWEIALVPEPVALTNLEGCRSNRCGSYGRLADGNEVCHRCTCIGRDLLTKCRQKDEFCPADPPIWDNRTVLTIKATDGKPD